MTIRIDIRGLVQGVGFRPFIYRLATEMRLTGEVDNRNNGVCVRVTITPEALPRFIERIRREKPVVAYIHRLEVTPISPDLVFQTFSIVPSHSVSDEVTQVSPDIAVCEACMKDAKEQTFRKQYPFINCTQCGPRFTIIRALPYDRKQTTMAGFPLCDPCKKEYEEITNRRFHAQPIACNNCGPTYYFLEKGATVTSYPRILELSASLLEAGQVIAVKGTGGYHLVCNARNTDAVRRLRICKKRDGKPFAVMFRDLEAVKRHAVVNEEEERNLLSWRRPIVLLRERQILTAGINTGLKTLGCMLPYMPIHYHWFERLQTDALVMTSGNLSDIPILITPEEAEQTFRPLTALVVHHNREIYNRADDSVVHVCGEKCCLIRRSRGYVPEPFFADIQTDGILAFGAEKVNTFALGKEDTIIQSQYIGDLKNGETLAFYQEALERFRALFRFTPRQLVCDLHPDYLSSQEAERMAMVEGRPLLRVQHHHAHAAACMLEHGLHEQLIAVVLDGTGLGDDGTSWGGEFFLCNRQSYRRMAHIESVPLPGGDKVSGEPWRMAVAVLFHYFGKAYSLPEAFARRIGKEKIQMLQQMMEKKINTPYSSGAGRVFDATAALLGLCYVATFQAEAPMRLEQVADDEYTEHYPISVASGVISLSGLFEGVMRDMADAIPPSRIAARFHNSWVELIVAKCKQLLRETKTSKVVLSGGCFQNKRLTEQLMLRFEAEHIALYIPERIPCNDGGIAAGQLAVAAARNILNQTSCTNCQSL